MEDRSTSLGPSYLHKIFQKSILGSLREIILLYRLLGSMNPVPTHIFQQRISIRISNY